MRCRDLQLITTNSQKNINHPLHKHVVKIGMKTTPTF